MAKLYCFRRSLIGSPTLNDAEKHILTSLMAFQYLLTQKNEDISNGIKSSYSYLAETFSYFEEDVIRALLYLDYKGYITFEPLDKHRFSYTLNSQKIDRDFEE